MPSSESEVYEMMNAKRVDAHVNTAGTVLQSDVVEVHGNERFRSCG